MQSNKVSFFDYCIAKKIWTFNCHFNQKKPISKKKVFKISLSYSYDNSLLWIKETNFFKKTTRLFKVTKWRNKMLNLLDITNKDYWW